MATVVLDRVTKTYPGNVVAVEAFDLTISDRELVVIVGPSGCGKTTTLRLIAGLEQLTRGTIRIGDEVVNDLPAQDRDVAMVFQNFALYPHLTVYENLGFGLKLRRRRVGLAKAEIDRRVRAAAATLGLSSMLERTPHELSGGERQRVAIGRAIVREPQTFLFDEPLSGLDPPLRVQMQRELMDLHQRIAVSMLYVTHNQSEAMCLGDRIVVMDRGVVQQIGTAAELYENPNNRFVGGFIGMPPMSFLEGRLAATDAGLQFEAEQIVLPLPRHKSVQCQAHVGRMVILGVRPEAVSCGLESHGVHGRRRLTGRVAAVEPSGHEKTVHVRIGHQRVTCRGEARTRIEREELVELAIDMSRTHVFEKETGANITRASENCSPGG